MFLISQVHLKVKPATMLENSHPVRALYSIPKLPENPIPGFIGEALAVGLKDTADAPPYCVVKTVQWSQAIVHVSAAEKLKRVNHFHVGQVLLSPNGGGSGLIVNDSVYKFLQLLCPKLSLCNWIFLNDCDFLPGLV